MKNRLSLLCSLLSCLALPAYAEQVKPAMENKTITAKVAAKELTRLHVEGDRIYQVRGGEHTYHLEKDERDGSIFIRPQESYQARPFSIFITTEYGRTYPLLLIPVDVPSDAIVIKPMGASKEIAERWETNGAYTQTLMNLISAMVQEEQPTGYAITELNQALPSQVGVLSLRLKKRYLGARLNGEVITITNTGKSIQNINAQQFYTQETRAITLGCNQLSPGSQTLLYRVVKNDE